LLASSDEGSRNSACIGLAGIGPLADQALPALRKALADPSADVRTFAKRAIEVISKNPSLISGSSRTRPLFRLSS
jgi:hypothetical protein